VFSEAIAGAGPHVVASHVEALETHMEGFEIPLLTFAVADFVRVVFVRK
jgi:hypothetical protein